MQWAGPIVLGNVKRTVTATLLNRLLLDLLRSEKEQYYIKQGKRLRTKLKYGVSLDLTKSHLGYHPDSSKGNGRTH